MMKLSVEAHRRAVAFIRSKARPLEQALYAFYFENAGPDGVFQSLAAFQNADGGFGHGLEPDLTMPDSSVICTSRGLQTLASIGASSDCPAVKSAVRYLLETYDPKRRVWEIVPRLVNEYPRAEWWDYTEDQETKWGGYLANPRAEVLGCLLDYRTHVPLEFLKELTDEVLGCLERSLDRKPDMHDFKCYLTLLETKAMPADVRTRLTGLLEPMVLSAVERDPAKWRSYCLSPACYMGAVRTPGSPFARLLAREVEMFLDFDLGRQQEDGAWHPSWSWGNRFPQEWARARQAWQGILTFGRLITFKRFGRLMEK